MDSALLEAFGLDPDVLHLNHGAFGVAPVVVRRAAAAWRERAERNPHRFNRVEIGGLVAAARERAAGFLGVDPSRAAWVRNVSEGLSAVLGSLELHSGDELVISTHGYGAVRKALSHHAARAGARIVEAVYPVGAGDDVIVSAYAAACSSRTRLVVIDRITSPTATVVPVAAVAAAVAGVGTSVLVDAAHAPGQLRDDIPALGADHWIGNLHKWAYTPRGSAILWSRPGAAVMPTVLSWQLEDGYAASFDYPGTWDYAGWQMRHVDSRRVAAPCAPWIQAGRDKGRGSGGLAWLTILIEAKRACGSTTGFAGFAWGPCLVARTPPWGVGRRQEGGLTMILPKVRDPRFVTIRRGGTLTDSDHQLLALWAASCAEHVLDLFESAQPEDPRPRQAIEHARAWVRGEVKMTRARTAAGHAMAAARDLRGAARHAAYAAGQAAVVAHVAAHELGAAAYAIKAARAGAPEGEGDGAGRLECRWQRDQLPEAIRELVLDDQQLRNDICWSVFDC